MQPSCLEGSAAVLQAENEHPLSALSEQPLAEEAEAEAGYIGQLDQFSRLPNNASSSRSVAVLGVSTCALFPHHQHGAYEPGLRYLMSQASDFEPQIYGAPSCGKLGCLCPAGLAM